MKRPVCVCDLIDNAVRTATLKRPPIARGRNVDGRVWSPSAPMRDRLRVGSRFAIDGDPDPVIICITP